MFSSAADDMTQLALLSSYKISKKKSLEYLRFARGRIWVKTPSIPGTLGVGMGAEGRGARLMIRLQFGLKNGISESEILVYYND